MVQRFFCDSRPAAAFYTAVAAAAAPPPLPPYHNIQHPRGPKRNR